MQTTITKIVFNVQRRTQWVRARTRLGNQIAALSRMAYGLNKGDALPKTKDPAIEDVIKQRTAPLAIALDLIDESIGCIEKELVANVRELPVAAWWCSHRGMAALGLATIIGEAGDLGAYRGPACIWKRFGMHVTEAGAAPRPKAGETLGYSPRRRAVIKMIGKSIVMQGIRKGEVLNPYRQVYDDRKAYEVAKAPELKPAQHDARAMRYMEKRVLRDLYNQWAGKQPIPETEFAKAA